MILVMKKSFYWLFVIGLVVLPFGYALYLYPSLPARIPIHFNIKGEVDGWGSAESIFLGPAIMGLTSLFVFFIFSNISKLDPKRYADANPANYLALGFAIVLIISILSLSIIYSSVDESLKVGKLFLPSIILLFILPVIFSYRFFKKSKQ
jgi:uncharacterized membrane protein